MSAAYVLPETETLFNVWFEKKGKLDCRSGFGLKDGREECEKLFQEKDVTLVALIGPEGKELRWTKD